MSALICGGVHSRRGFGSRPLRRVLALEARAISQRLHVYLVLATSPAARSKRPKIARPSPGGSGLLRPSASSTPRPARQRESAEGDNRRAFACVDRAITTNTDSAVGAPYRLLQLVGAVARRLIGRQPGRRRDLLCAAPDPAPSAACTRWAAASRGRCKAGGPARSSSAPPAAGVPGTPSWAARTPMWRHFAAQGPARAQAIVRVSRPGGRRARP